MLNESNYAPASTYQLQVHYPSPVYRKWLYFPTAFVNIYEPFMSLLSVRVCLAFIARFIPVIFLGFLFVSVISEIWGEHCVNGNQWRLIVLFADCGLQGNFNTSYKFLYGSYSITRGLVFMMLIWLLLNGNRSHICLLCIYMLSYRVL